MEKVNLKDCTLSFLDETFGLKEVLENRTLTQWLSYNHTASDFEKQYLLTLQHKLLLNIRDWNEQELLSNFIVPMFTLVNFTTDYFNDFAERNIQVTIGDYLLSGNPDGIIATGRREPKVPYFTFQEYKPQTDPTGEPQGQCVAAMLVGQSLNGTSKPVYGCYVIGKEWNFVVLEGNEYCISKAFLVDDEEIFDVYAILQGLKHILLALFN